MDEGAKGLGCREEGRQAAGWAHHLTAQWVGGRGNGGVGNAVTETARSEGSWCRGVLRVDGWRRGTVEGAARGPEENREVQAGDTREASGKGGEAGGLEAGLPRMNGRDETTERGKAAGVAVTEESGGTEGGRKPTPCLVLTLVTPERTGVQRVFLSFLNHDVSPTYLGLKHFTVFSRES